jgi:hypothetical protein
MKNISDLNKKQSEFSKIAEVSRELLRKLEAGKEYPSFYVVNRFEKVASERSNDQLIRHMTDVISKIASKQEFISQNEIASIYDRMVGLSGGNSYFRHDLGDLLPENRQFAEPEQKQTNLRVDDENSIVTANKNTELSDAFAKVLGVNTEGSFQTFNPRKNTSIEKVVVASLHSIGHTPENVKVTHRNDHYALCTAFYTTKGFDKVAVQIPVNITGGGLSTPEHFVADGELVPLTKDNIYLHFKNEEYMKNASRQAKTILARDDGKEQIEIENIPVPQELKDYTDVESALIAAASNYNINQLIEILYLYILMNYLYQIYYYY